MGEIQLKSIKGITDKVNTNVNTYTVTKISDLV